MSVVNLIRKPNAIVFGGAGLRAATYRAHGAKLFQWASESGLELHDVGPTLVDPQIQSFLLQSNVVVHGRLPAVELSELLRYSTLGVLSYPLPYASKSSVLGAYCAHGLCPVIFPDSAYPGDSLDGLRHGVNFIDGTHLGHLQLSQICEIGKHAWDWYGNHTVQRHVSAITSMGLKGITDER